MKKFSGSYKGLKWKAEELPNLKGNYKMTMYDKSGKLLKMSTGNNLDNLKKKLQKEHLKVNLK